LIGQSSLNQGLDLLVGLTARGCGDWVSPGQVQCLGSEDLQSPLGGGNAGGHGCAQEAGTIMCLIIGHEGPIHRDRQGSRHREGDGGRRRALIRRLAVGSIGDEDLRPLELGEPKASNQSGG
jgi:hypothetical protein